MKYFNEDMSYTEALKTLYTIIVGKDKDEAEKIKEEYRHVIPIITKKELSEPLNQLTSYEV